MRLVSLIASLVLMATLTGCGSSTSGPESAPATAAAPTQTVTTDTEQPSEDAQPTTPMAACRARPATGGDVIVRNTEPGLPTKAQLIGGGWAWNFATQQCQTSTDFTISGASRTRGACTQVASAADNPGYDVDKQPAPPLKKITASVCH